MNRFNKVNVKLHTWLEALNNGSTPQINIVWREPALPAEANTDPPGDVFEPMYGAFATIGTDPTPYLLWVNPEATNILWQFAITPTA